MELHFVLKILQFAFLCSETCSANIFGIFSNLEEFTTTKASFPTERELAITNEDPKQARNDSSKKELTSEVSAFTELKPMEAFIAKTSNGRESVLNSLFELNLELKEKEEEKEKENEEEKKGEKREEVYFLDEKDGKSISSLIENLQILPLVKNEVSIPNELVNNNGSLTQYIDSLRENAWSHFKAIVHQYVNAIAPTEYNGKDSILTNLLFKSLDLGDNINIIHLLGKKVDPKIYDFMKSKLQPLTKALQASPLSGTFLPKNSTFLFPSVNELVNDVAWMAIQHIIQNLLTRIDSKDELLSYADDLSKINPFAAKGLLFALNLPTKRPKSPPVMEEGGTGRSYYIDGYRDSYSRPKSNRYRDDTDISRDGHGHHDDGYDHHDGYGYEVDHGYGYEMSKDYYLDPYLILAGIGAAALLAYIAYRILTTTMATGGIKKRDLDQMDIDISFSIYNHIENGKLKYENDFSSEAENFVEGVNELWFRKASNSCMKCWLGKKLEAHNLSSFKILFLSVVSNLFGADDTGQFLDHTAQNILNGKPFSCIDDIQYCQ